MPTTSTSLLASNSSIEVVKLRRLNSWQRSLPSCSFKSQSWMTFQSSLFSAPEMMLRPSPRPSTPRPSFFITDLFNRKERKERRDQKREAAGRFRLGNLRPCDHANLKFVGAKVDKQTVFKPCRF